MIFVKPGVSISGLRPEILLAVIAAERVYAEAGHDLTITAGLDGKHMAGSLHYAGAAVDLRTRDVPADKIPGIVARLKETLAGNFDVVMEGDHIHVEFQPKHGLAIN